MATHSIIGGPFALCLRAKESFGLTSPEYLSRLSDMTRLALVFRCAHGSSDVWMGGRLDRALAGYSRPGLNEYLSGCYFSGYVADDESIPELDALKVDAEDFLAQHEVG